MDFRRPGEHPVEDLSHHYDGTDGMMPPVQTYHDQQRAVSPPKSTKGLKSMVWFLSILLFGVIGYATYAYLNEQTLRSRLTDTEAKVATLSKDLAVLQAKQDESDKAAPDESLPAEELVAKTAGAYACNIDKFGCDKLSKTVLKIQKYIAPGPGLAIVKVTSASSGATTNLYMRTVDGLDWVVIYEGTGSPSTEIAKRYALPTDFTRVP